MSHPSPGGGALARVDAELARLHHATEVIAANLVDLEAEPAKRSLADGPLTGRTKAAWAQATVALGQLWDGYTALNELLTNVGTRRTQRRITEADEAELAELVFGHSITLSTTTVPLAQRTLLGPAEQVTTCTPAQLLTAMEAAFSVVRAPIVEAGAVWNRLLAATAATTTALTDTRTRVTAAGADPTTINDADRRLSQFVSALSSDPLSCSNAELSSIDAAIARAAAELTSAEELVASLHTRLADAHALAERITSAEGAAATAHRSATAKLAVGDVHGVADDPTLRPDLATLDALAGAGQWHLLGARLTAWMTRATAHLTTLADAERQNRAALAERAELRGRLSGYRAKAARLGLAEHAVLAELDEDAKTLLYHAPCDLAAARAAVRRYQSAVAQYAAPDPKDRGQR